MNDRTRVFNCDCLPAMREFPDKYFDLAIVDPPYGLERFKNGGSHLNKYGSENGSWNNIKPVANYWAELFRISNKQIIWGGNNFDLPESEYFIIWHKSNASDFSFAMCEYAWTNCNVPAKIFTKLHVQTLDGRIHPTQKPVALYKWLLKNYAKEGDKILDTHGGSMSSVIACLDMGYPITCYELDSDYYAAGKKRIEQYLAQQKIFDTHREVEFIP